ncbi:PREDICTED: sortilin-related receptor-like [Branchiostoma belcheri]|uniref:Sortilin-related receptor-like n=1 Tax=Branchiostoma belcheri TaxID=7741 RepID=A0A6P4ZGT1_BRABE|nr:PREDICTED: sortilin-related receptor-like [Branchiostoma belcheri]
MFKAVALGRCSFGTLKLFLIFLILDSAFSVVNDDYFTPYDFNVDNSCNSCHGAKYVKRSQYSYGGRPLYVGVILCSFTRYKILMSDSLSGTFRNIGDRGGHGQDHCELVGALVDPPSSALDSDYRSCSGTGFWRRLRGDQFNYGAIGDGSVNGNIWYGRWYECGLAIQASCGGIFVDASGIITSPGYPGSYGNNEYCVYTIRAPSGNFVRLDFQEFNLESRYDNLRIFEDGSEIQRYTGSSLPPTYISSTNAVQLVFTSDGSVTLTGFNLTYSYANECAFINGNNCPAHATCNGTFTCTCNTGFTGNGVQCTDLNECVMHADNCDLHATCTNTPGSFTCACVDGYYGNGTSCSVCGHCAGGSACNTVSGICPACLSPWTGQLCQEMPAEVTNDPENITQSLSQSAMFTCAGRGEPMPNVTWRHGGRRTIPTGAVTTIQSQAQHTFTSTLTFNSVQRADNGEYTCTAANSLQTDTSSPATLIVLERPGEINVTVASQRSTTLYATADVGFTGNQPVTAIHVRSRRKGESFWGNWTSVGFAGTRGTVNITGLTPATDYIGQVRAQNSEGWSRSVQFTWRTRDAPPGPPSRLQTSSISSHSISITWQRPAVPNGVITHYSIRYGPTMNCSDSELLHEVTTQGSNTSLTFPGLLPNTMYTFRVRGFTSAGAGNFTDCLHARTAAAEVYVQTKPTAFPLAAVIGGAVAAGVLIFAIAAALMFYRYVSWKVIVLLQYVYHCQSAFNL